MGRRKQHNGKTGEPLLLALGPLIDADMLQEIASADYGCDIPLHLAALLPIRNDGIVPAEMGWEPREVLELIRWSQPDHPQWSPGGQGRRGHLMRAFACAALLAGGRSAANRTTTFGYCDTILHLIRSLDALNLPLKNMAADLIGAVVAAAGPDDFSMLHTLMMHIGRLHLLLSAKITSGELSLAVDQMGGILAEMDAAADTWPNNIGQMKYDTLYAGKWLELAAEIVPMMQSDLSQDVATAINKAVKVLTHAD